jgi:hypothetical protein
VIPGACIPKLGSFLLDVDGPGDALKAASAELDVEGRDGEDPRVREGDPPTS